MERQVGLICTTTADKTKEFCWNTPESLRGLRMLGSYLGEHFKQLVRGPLQGTGGKEEGSQAATWFRREPERAAPDVM